MIAQAVTGTPGHVNTMAAAVPHFINDIGPDRIHPGDAYITNDPWKGTGHLHDITVTTPVFVGDELIGFFASTAHVVDIGGRGYGPDAREVYEEGSANSDHEVGGAWTRSTSDVVEHSSRNNVREARPGRGRHPRPRGLATRPGAAGCLTMLARVRPLRSR